MCRPYFKRLVSIVHSRVTLPESPSATERPRSPSKVDFLERELLEEQELESMGAVARARRTHGAALLWDDRVQLDKRYNRVGMAKTISGAAFADMNASVIVTGVPALVLSVWLYGSARMRLCFRLSDRTLAYSGISEGTCDKSGRTEGRSDPTCDTLLRKVRVVTSEILCRGVQGW